MTTAPEFLILVCGRVERDRATGNVTLYDLFDVLSRSGIPADIGPFSLYVRVHRIPRGATTFPLKGVFEGPDGRPIFEFDCTVPATADSGHSEATMDSLVVDRVGIYRFVLYRDAQEVAATSFKVEVRNVDPTRAN